jgi:hypothetical protein
MPSRDAHEPNLPRAESVRANDDLVKARASLINHNNNHSSLLSL